MAFRYGRAGGPVKGHAYTKASFRLNLRDFTILCPAGELETIRPGAVVEFDPEACHRCPQRSQCTMAGAGHGRTISIAADEKLQQRLRKRIATRKGRRPAARASQH